MLPALSLVLALQCAAQVPQRNLEVRFRQIDSEQVFDEPSLPGQIPADVTASTRRTAPDRPAIQQVRLLNGQWGFIRIARSQPVQWMRTVAGQGLAPGAAGSAVGGVRGIAVPELTWLEAGQSLAVRARWPGGNKPAVLDIQVSLDQVDVRRTDDLPNTSQSQAATTVVVPLERWTSFASSQSDTRADTPGTLSTETLRAQPRQLFQVFVHVP